MTLDHSGFDRNQARFARNLRPMREDAVRGTATRFQGRIARDWPRDTNRSYRGFAMAARDLGVPGISVPPIKESNYAEQQLRRLRAQVNLHGRAVNRWAAFEAAYQKAGRTHQKYYRKILSEIRFHEKRYRRAVQELFRFARAIEEGGAPVVIGRGRKKYRRGVAIYTRLATVRATSYGGFGRIRRSINATIAEVVNKEPHTRIVERNRRIAGRSLREASRGSSARRVGRKKAVEMLRTGTTWTPGQGAVGAVA